MARPSRRLAFVPECDDTGLALRRTHLGAYGALPVGLQACVAKPVQKSRARVSWTANVSGVSFFAAVVVYILTGLACVATPPLATTDAAGKDVPADATCLRAVRHTNYVAVQLVMGSPPSLFDLLLRLDVAKSENRTAMRLFSNRVAESDTVACHAGVCTDVALLHTQGPSSRQRRHVVQFEYTNPTSERLTYGTASTMGLDGEFALQIGHEYYFTATHACWVPATPPPDADSTYAPVRVVDEALRVDAGDLTRVDALRDSPVAVAFADGVCAQAAEVALFPGRASDEATWLGLASKRAYETFRKAWTTVVSWSKSGHSVRPTTRRTRGRTRSTNSTVSRSTYRATRDRRCPFAAWRRVHCASCCPRTTPPWLELRHARTRGCRRCHSWRKVVRACCCPSSSWHS